MIKKMLLSKTYLVLSVVLGLGFLVLSTPSLAFAQRESFEPAQIGKTDSVQLHELGEYAFTELQFIETLATADPLASLNKLFEDQVLEKLIFSATIQPREQEVFARLKAEKTAQTSANKGKMIEQAKKPATDSKGKYLGNFVVTAYCNCTKCQGQWVGTTASGRAPKVGITIAVDPKVIPLGSKITILGLGFRVAEDTGGKIKGNRIDVYMSDHKEALNWGKQTLEVWSAK